MNSKYYFTTWYINNFKTQRKKSHFLHQSNDKIRKNIPHAETGITQMSITKFEVLTALGHLKFKVTEWKVIEVLENKKKKSKVTTRHFHLIISDLSTISNSPEPLRTPLDALQDQIQGHWNLKVKAIVLFKDHFSRLFQTAFDATSSRLDINRFVVVHFPLSFYRRCWRIHTNVDHLLRVVLSDVGLHNVPDLKEKDNDKLLFYIHRTTCILYIRSMRKIIIYSKCVKRYFMIED